MDPVDLLESEVRVDLLENQANLDLREALEAEDHLDQEVHLENLVRTATGTANRLTYHAFIKIL